jgi:hypothetical protein
MRLKIDDPFVVRNAGMVRRVGVSWVLFGLGIGRVTNDSVFYL